MMNRQVLILEIWIGKWKPKYKAQNTHAATNWKDLAMCFFIRKRHMRIRLIFQKEKTNLNEKNSLLTHAVWDLQTLWYQQNRPAPNLAPAHPCCLWRHGVFAHANIHTYD